MSLKVALVGYGKMGRALDLMAPNLGIEVVGRIDHPAFERTDLGGADVAIEFTAPQGAYDNIERLAGMGVNVVVGTTGWLDRMDDVRALVDQHEIGVVWSPNFSIGVQAFARIVREAARLLAEQEAYGAWAYEIHHEAKLDAPSGTLLMLVEQMAQGGYERNVSVASNRAGAIPGTHEIGFDAPFDTITLRHTARTRDGFARGALVAAQWVQGKRGLHEFSDIVFS